MLDDNTSTFWSSDWHNVFSSSIGHYFDIDLGSTGKLYHTLKVGYTTRDQWNAACPYTIILYGSSDGNDWFEIHTLTHEEDGLPDWGPEAVEYGNFFSLKAFDHVRFAVTRSYQNGSIYYPGTLDWGSVALAEFDLWVK